MVYESGTGRADPIDVLDPSLWTDEQRAYLKVVDRACAASKDMLIGNGNATHAVFLMDRFFAYAQRKVRLFSGSLVQTVPYQGDQSLLVYASTRLVKSAGKFLERPKARLHILLEGDLDVPPGESRLAHPLIAAAAKSPEKYSLKRVSGEWLDALRAKDFLLHWMTVDDTGFRLETDPDQHTALANFRSPKHVKVLSELFDRLEQHAEPIAV